MRAATPTSGRERAPSYIRGKNCVNCAGSCRQMGEVKADDEAHAGILIRLFWNCMARKGQRSARAGAGQAKSRASATFEDGFRR